ncbi:hypothetical protein V6N13_103670 [Hibiscus sabdariffa]
MDVVMRIWRKPNNLVHYLLFLICNDELNVLELSRSDRWKAPLASSHKINVDGAYISETDATMISIVARNENEAWALAEGIKMAVTNSWENVTMENDAIGLINRMLSPNND